MKERLEVPGLVARVPDHQTRSQLFSAQGDGVCDAEGIVLPLRGNGLEHAVRETEVQLHGGVAGGVGKGARFGGGLAQVLPFGGAGEAVLREAGGWM